jgi:hypothetical protein
LLAEVYVELIGARQANSVSPRPISAPAKHA